MWGEPSCGEGEVVGGLKIMIFFLYHSLRKLFWRFLFPWFSSQGLVRYSGDFFGGYIELDVVCEAVALKSMMANYVTKEEHVREEEVSMNWILGNTLGQGSCGEFAVIDAGELVSVGKVRFEPGEILKVDSRLVRMIKWLMVVLKAAQSSSRMKTLSLPVSGEEKVVWYFEHSCVWIRNKIGMVYRGYWLKSQTWVEGRQYFGQKGEVGGQ